MQKAMTEKNQAPSQEHELVQESQTWDENVIRVSRKLIIYTTEYILSMKDPLHYAPSQLLHR